MSSRNCSSSSRVSLRHFPTHSEEQFPRRQRLYAAADFPPQWHLLDMFLDSGFRLKLRFVVATCVVHDVHFLALSTNSQLRRHRVIVVYQQHRMQVVAVAELVRSSTWAAEDVAA